jgi:hypothetical protein
VNNVNHGKDSPSVAPANEPTPDGDWKRWLRQRRKEQNARDRRVRRVELVRRLRMIDWRVEQIESRLASLDGDVRGHLIDHYGPPRPEGR